MSITLQPTIFAAIQASEGPMTVAEIHAAVHAVGSLASKQTIRKSAEELFKANEVERVVVTRELTAPTRRGTTWARTRKMSAYKAKGVEVNA